MKIAIQDVRLPIEIKNKPIKISVHGSGNHYGNLMITKSKIVWCKPNAKSIKNNEGEMTLSELIKKIQETKKPKLKLKKCKK